MLYSFCNADSGLCWLADRTPSAFAEIHGSNEFPDIYGHAVFFQRVDGVFLVFQVTGLPVPQEACASSLFAMHIHEGESCTGTTADPFADAGTHYNPLDCPHPSHAGDLPPLLGNDGYAWGAVFTSRFTVSDIIGRTLIIHRNPDDFVTQPSGNSGAKIACGVINQYSPDQGPVLY